MSKHVWSGMEDPRVIAGLEVGLPVLVLCGLLGVQFYELARRVRS